MSLQGIIIIIIIIITIIITIIVTAFIIIICKYKSKVIPVTGSGDL
jgi:hypothetical protein